MTRSDRRLLWLSLAVIAALVVSGVQPYDRTTWILEVAPVLVALPILYFTRERFPLTPLLYLVICLHCLVLILGGAYTYARVPLGYWLQDFLELTRNPYDKIGHFMQGFTPALLARELFMRNGHVNGAKMSAFLAVCVSLAVSAVYELIEWWTALLLGQGADEFLGTQGDVWDTQSDMFLALLGAIAALVLLSRLQRRQVVALQAR
jgi:putative membrane protein